MWICLIYILIIYAKNYCFLTETFERRKFARRDRQLKDSENQVSDFELMRIQSRKYIQRQTVKLKLFSAQLRNDRGRKKKIDPLSRNRGSLLFIILIFERQIYQPNDHPLRKCHLTLIYTSMLSPSLILLGALLVQFPSLFASVSASQSDLNVETREQANSSAHDLRTQRQKRDWGAWSSKNGQTKLSQAGVTGIGA